MQPLYVLTLVIAAGVVAQWVAAGFRFPAILLLLATGLALGPLTGIVDPDKLFGPMLQPFLSLAVAVVLFEGGLCLNLREARHVGSTLWRLLLAGLVVGSVLTAVLAFYVGGLDVATAAVLGAILVVTGPTVILPMLRGARIALRPATLLKWEGIVNDPLGALLAVFVFEVATSAFSEGRHDPFHMWLLKFGLYMCLTGGMGGLLGYILGKALNFGWITEHLKGPVILAGVLTVFSFANLILHESGLLAVTIMGLVLANVDHASIEDIRRFKEQISTLLVSILFIVLSATLDMDSLKELWGRPLLLILMVLVVVRPVVALVATIGSQIPWRERLLLGWIAPRGVVAAAMAGAFAPGLMAAGYSSGEQLVPIVFGVIICTVVLHGLSLKPLAKRLGLAAVEGRGILIVGASQWSVSLAQALAKAGADVVLADTRFRRVSRARQEGLEVHYGDVLAEDAALELPMERVSWVLAAADDDAYNALVCLRFVPEFGREAVLQLTPATGEGSKDLKTNMKGRNPWGEDASYRRITSRFWKGNSFKATGLSESFSWEELQAKNLEALFLFYVHQGKLRVLEEGAQPVDSSKLVYLA